LGFVCDRFRCSNSLFLCTCGDYIQTYVRIHTHSMKVETSSCVYSFIFLYVYKSHSSRYVSFHFIFCWLQSNLRMRSPLLSRHLYEKVTVCPFIENFCPIVGDLLLHVWLYILILAETVFLVYVVKLASILYFVNYFILNLTLCFILIFITFVSIEVDNLTLKIIVPIVIVVVVVVLVVVFLWRKGAFKKLRNW
jgi:hypothetical protein